MLSGILETNAGDPFARYGLAMAYAAEGQNDEALREYATIIDGNPDYVPAYQMSAQLLLREGREEEARGRLEDGVAACRRTGNAHAEAEMQAMLDELGG